MSIGLYIVLAPLYLKSVRKLQEKRFVFVKILAIIIPENGAKVSKIKCFQFAQQTLYRKKEQVARKSQVCDLKIRTLDDADENGYLSGVTFLDVTQLKTTGSEAQRLGRGG